MFLETGLMCSNICSSYLSDNKIKKEKASLLHEHHEHMTDGYSTESGKNFQTGRKGFQLQIPVKVGHQSCPGFLGQAPILLSRGKEQTQEIKHFSASSELFQRILSFHNCKKGLNHNRY